MKYRTVIQVRLRASSDATAMQAMSKEMQAVVQVIPYRADGVGIEVGLIDGYARLVAQSVVKPFTSAITAKWDGWPERYNLFRHFGRSE